MHGPARGSGWSGLEGWRQQSFALNMVQFSEGPWDAESEGRPAALSASGPSSCCPPFAHAATSLCRMGQDAVDAGHVSAAKGKSDVAVSTRSTPQHASLATPPIRLRGALGALAWLACAGPLASPWPSKGCRERWRWFISRTTEARGEHEAPTDRLLVPAVDRLPAPQAGHCDRG
jgi:hypothetical protein